MYKQEALVASYTADNEFEAEKIRRDLRAKPNHRRIIRVRRQGEGYVVNEYLTPFKPKGTSK